MVGGDWGRGDLAMRLYGTCSGVVDKRFLIFICLICFMEQEKIWDAIAEKWADFRKNPADEVVEFLKDKDGKVLDLGCGSGRNFLNKDELDFYGVDFSKKLLELAKKKGYFELKKGLSYEIPYEDDFFDWVVFARVLHCVDSAERRRKSLEEVYRVLSSKDDSGDPNSGGKVLISVWGRGQKRVKNKGKECFIPWTTNGKKHERYTYIYDEDELVEELEDVGFEVLRVERGKNIVVVARKN